MINQVLEDLDDFTRCKGNFYKSQMQMHDYLYLYFEQFKKYVMPKSQDPQSHDLSISSTLCYNSYTLYQISISFSKEKSPTCLRNTSSLKKLFADQCFISQ